MIYRAIKKVRRVVMGQPKLNLALIVGAQRSGTTWVQMLTAAHPLIAGSYESHLFSQYIGPLAMTYYRHAKEAKQLHRLLGLPCYLTSGQFDEMCRMMARETFLKLLKGKPRAKLIVEKTPDHILHLPYIRKLLPETKLVHVIRDPRDVAVSQRAASKQSWGTNWATADVAEAAERWVDWVKRGMSWREPARLYHELRYEKLLKDGPPELSRLYDFLGLPLAMNQVERIYEDFSLAKVAGNTAPPVLVHCGKIMERTAPPPKEFFRKGKSGGWREALNAEEQKIIRDIAGPMMQHLGYTWPDDDPQAAPSPDAPLAAGA